MLKNKENGYILIVVLLLLMVLTVVGMAAMETSTIENILSGNIRIREREMAKSEAGIPPSALLLNRCIMENSVSGFTNMISDANLCFELRNTMFPLGETPDLSFNIDGDPVTVDIDKMYTMYMQGAANEGHSGYEGIGKGAGKGSYTYYRINSTASNPLINSSSITGSIFTYIDK